LAANIAEDHVVPLPIDAWEPWHIRFTPPKADMIQHNRDVRCGDAAFSIMETVDEDV
jgi:hypothetical protein